jgi:hypothetical protein
LCQQRLTTESMDHKLTHERLMIEYNRMRIQISQMSEQSLPLPNPQRVVTIPHGSNNNTNAFDQTLPPPQYNESIYANSHVANGNGNANANHHIPNNSAMYGGNIGVKRPASSVNSSQQQQRQQRESPINAHQSSIHRAYTYKVSGIS